MIFEETQHSYSMFTLRRLPAKASGETEEAESSSRACHVAARFASLVVTCVVVVNEILLLLLLLLTIFILSNITSNNEFTIFGNEL